MLSVTVYNELVKIINTEDSDYFNLYIKMFGPFTKQFKMVSSSGEPLFETLIRRMISDPMFKVENLEWLESVSFNFHYASDLLDVELNYGYTTLTKEHLEYLDVIFQFLTKKEIEKL